MKQLNITITLTDEEMQAFEEYNTWLEQQRFQGLVSYDQGIEVAFSHFLSQWQHQHAYIYSAAEREQEQE